MARNLDLLERTFDYTVEHQDEWDQDWWVLSVRDRRGHVCGTVCCFAGNVLLVEGFRYEWKLIGDDECLVQIIDPTGKKVAEKSTYIEDKAEELLGLTKKDSRLLFCATNTLERLRAIIDGWKAEAAGEGS